MTAELKQFIAGYVALTNAEMNDIAGRFARRVVKKNEYLLHEGEVCKDMVFVQKGCLRLFNISDEVETSVWFSFEHSSAIEIASFISGEPTSYFIQAIEDSEILVLPKTELNKLYEVYPKMQEMMKNFLEDVVLNLINRFTSLQRDTAEKRYLDLLNKPAYLQKIPQKYLASFIGVTPTSLSRIRRKIR
ncbi:MAG: Crp/Fnr family transcriptional regulator [Sphingobacteriales bacterium]|nr:MAG: Crp/Fnr family transcriptional regulator [Sphingobacteriales bacterium]